jgi:reactive intermediate/imine deaminase
MKQLIESKNAPAAIGSYSPAVKVGNTVYLSGQIPLDPVTMNLVNGDMSLQVVRIFENLKDVAEAAGGNLDGVVKLTVYLLDLANISVVNDTIKKYFTEPFPARTSIQVAALPKNAQVEIDAVLVL